MRHMLLSGGLNEKPVESGYVSISGYIVLDARGYGEANGTIFVLDFVKKTVRIVGSEDGRGFGRLAGYDHTYNIDIDKTNNNFAWGPYNINIDTNLFKLEPEEIALLKSNYSLSFTRTKSWAVLRSLYFTDSELVVYIDDKRNGKNHDTNFTVSLIQKNT